MSGSIRLFIPQPLAAGAIVAASAGQAHYLGGVMRRAVGDSVCLFNGRDGEWSARISDLRRQDARLQVETLLRPQAAAPVADVWLAFALLKRDATELVVEKATELGAEVIWPVSTVHTVVPRTNLDRLRAIAVEAAEQSERLTVPAIRDPVRLGDLLAGWPDERRLFVAAERARVPMLAPATGPRGLLVGPEGGFAQAELDALAAHPLVTFVSLGPRILRAETAAIAGLARLQGDGCG